MADNNIDPEVIRELTEKYEQMRDAIASMVPAMVLSTTAINQMIAASKGLTVSEKEGTDVVKEYVKSIKEATEKTERENKAKEKNAADWLKIDITLKNAGASLNAFGSALLSSTNSMSKYQSSVTAGAKGLTDFVGGFLPKEAPIHMKLLLKGFTAVIDVLAFFVGAVFKQNDEMIKSFDSLSEVGATTSLTTNDIRKLGLNAGYTSDRLEKFTDITKGLGTDLLSLGTTAGKGVVEFSKIASVTQDTRDGFNRLGIGQEELTKIQANYVKTTIASGRALAQSPELLQKQSLKYATTLEELAALTGMSRDAQQKTLDEANANLNFQIHMYELGKKEAELRRQNTVDSIKQADAIHKQIDNTNAVVVVSKKMNSALDHTATLQLIAGKTWTESSAGLATKMPGLLKMLSRLDKGEDITVDFMDGMANATESMLKAAGGAMKIGEAGPEIAKALGISVESVKFLAEYRSKDANQRKAALEQIRIEIEARKAGKGAVDAAKDAQNEQLKTELALKKAFDELTNQISGPVNAGFKLLMQTTMSLAKTFAEISYKFGGPDLRHLFKTPEELKKDVEDLTNQASKLESALAKEVSLREDKLKNDEALNKKEKEYQEAKNKAIELGKNRPALDGKTPEEKTKEIEKWQAQRFEQDKLVKKLEEERSVLITKGYQMKRKIESQGMGSGVTAEQERLKAELEKKRAELAQAKKYATDAGVPTAPPPTSGKPTPAAAPVSPQKLEQRSAAAANLGTTKEGKAINTEDVLAKIRFKDRKENTGGGSADAKLIDIAQKINEAFPGSTITALNDMYHQNRRDRGGNIIKSRHTEGKALDFSLAPAPKDADEASLIKEQLKDLGASKVLDEYFADKNSQTTGGHFHVEVMKDGGVIQAQPGGTLVQAAEAGVNEAFVPLPKGRNIPVSMPSLDKLTKANTLLMDDIKLLVGDNISNSPLVTSITDKLTDKLNPEKLLLNFLTKNISGLGKVMTASNIVDTANTSEMSTSEKLLEIAKILNPTVRLVTKLYDTYQTISGDGFKDNPNKENSNLTELNNTRVEQQAQTSDLELITKLFNSKTSDGFSTKSNKDIPDSSGINNPYSEQQALITKLFNSKTSDGFSAKANTEIPDVNGIINSRVEQQQASQQELITKLSTAISSTPSGNNDSSGAMGPMVEMLAEKLDSMIGKLDTSNDIQDNLLKYSRI
jgi:hypothetical protein